MRSGTSKVWKLLPSAPHGTFNGVDLPPVVAEVLYHRGIKSSIELEAFLKPSNKFPYEPTLLPGVEQASYRLADAIKKREIIGVFGDFDVDGITGAALVAQGLQGLGAQVVPYIPHRVLEGHGLSASAVEALKSHGVSVVITVDCGITSHQEVILAHELGLDVIITDHHVPPQVLPPAHSIINPKLSNNPYPFQELCGAGVVFKLVQGLYNLLGSQWDNALLELAALGTVADLTPLVDENRYLVKSGIQAMRATQRPGLRALCRHASIDPRSIDIQSISFGIAPRLNAPGRLDHALASYRLLTTDSDEEAEGLASRIETLNRQRRQLTKDATAGAMEEMTALDPLPPILLVQEEGLSPGISGLVASRLLEEFYRPVVVMSLEGEMVRASARSIKEFNVVSALAQCQDLFIKFGGHQQAAGFLMDRQNLSKLKERLTIVAEDMLTGLNLQPTIEIDAQVPLEALKGETFRWLKALEPFGQGNPTPMFQTSGVAVTQARLMGNGGEHLRLKLKQGGITWDAVAFRQGGSWDPSTHTVDLVYTLGTERRGGQKVLALQVVDFRPA